MRSYREFFPRPVVGAEKDFYFAELSNVQRLLRDVWQERDGEKREWAIYMLRNYSAKTITAEPMFVLGEILMLGGRATIRRRGTGCNRP